MRADSVHRAMDVDRVQESCLIEIADALDKAHRYGAAEDVTEGRRWIKISDTLAKDMSKRLRACEAERHHIKIDC